MQPLLIFLCSVFVFTAAAQIDERPPIIRRAPQSPVDPGPAAKSDKKLPDTVTGAGIVRSIDAKTIEVAIDDGRIFKAAIDSKTAFIGPEGKVNADTVKPGVRVRISAKSNDELYLTATSVVVEKPPAPAKPEDDAATMKTEDSDPERPVLKRGMPQKAASPNEDAEPLETAAPVGHTSNDNSLADSLAADSQADLINKAREVNREFIAHLPNFVCQQYTTRYERESKLDGWKAKDIISATVLYEKGIEHYDNIKINNRAANADMMAIKGARSTGEFGSFLSGLFATDVNAEFHYLHAESFRRVHTRVFKYSVKRETTDWTISVGGQSIEPAYSGRIWIDSDTARVMRIERQADNIPESFPMTITEQTIDYDTVMLGTRKLLLPVESSSLSCQRDSTFCAKNSIQFRDYKEFRGEATITFDK